MWFKYLLGTIIVLILAIGQTSLLKFNLLLVAAVFWGLKADWRKLFLLGLLVDVVGGSRLGGNSLIYLFVGGLAFLVKHWLPARSQPEVRLRL